MHDSESGFEQSSFGARSTKPARLELVTAIALAFSTLVAVTAVSIGIARADMPGGPPDSAMKPFAIAMLISLLFAVMGGLTAAMAESAPKRKRRR